MSEANKHAADPKDKAKAQHETTAALAAASVAAARDAPEDTEARDGAEGVTASHLAVRFGRTLAAAAGAVCQWLQRRDWVAFATFLLALATAWLAWVASK